MKQGDKELLLKDLCARLPYGVEIHIDFTENGHIVGDAVLDNIKAVTGQLFGFTDFKRDFKNGDSCPISGFGGNRNLHLEDFKPYLRPMSSMTEEEYVELRKMTITSPNLETAVTLFWEHHYDESPNWRNDWTYCALPKVLDWLNAHHFDFRGLIEKGLALEAPEGMYT